MRLMHAGFKSYVVGEMVTPPVGRGDLFLVSAGPGHFPTVETLLNVAREAGGRTAAITAQPAACRADAGGRFDPFAGADDGGHSCRSQHSDDGHSLRGFSLAVWRSAGFASARAHKSKTGGHVHAIYQYEVKVPLTLRSQYHPYKILNQNQPYMKTKILLVAALATSVLPTARLAIAEEAAAIKTAEKIESVDLEKTFGPVPAPTKPLRFAYVTKTLINEFWQDVAAGIKSEAGKYNIKFDAQAAKDESSLVEQLNLAQTILSQKPTALLLSPQSDSNLVPAIQAAKKNNIPTVVIDDARTEGANCYVGTDQVAIGAKAAEFLHQLYPDGGKVAQIEGQAGSPNARARIKGFTETVKKYDNLKLVASQPGNWDRMTALNVTSNILRQHPDLVGIYANNDGMALGVVEAVKKAGKLKEVAIVGTDGIREAKRSITDGEMRATVAEFPYDEGKLGVEVALRILAGQPFRRGVVSPQAVITAENVKDFPNPPEFQK